MASIIGGPVVPPYSIQDISSSLRLCKFAYTRLDGRIDEGKLEQTALSLERRVSGEREQVSAAIVSKDRPGEKRERRVSENGDDAMASILTPSRKQNELFASEVVA